MSPWVEAASPEIPAPARRRMASPNDKPSTAARRSIASNCSSVRLKRSWSISTHLPRMQSEPVGLREQAFDLGPRELFAVERHLHAEVEQRVQAELRRSLAADRCLHLRPCRPVHAPARRHSHDDPGAFERGNVFKKLQCLLRAPAQRVKNFARVDHSLQPGAVFAGALNRHQQRQ